MRGKEEREEEKEEKEEKKLSLSSHKQRISEIPEDSESPSYGDSNCFRDTTT